MMASESGGIENRPIVSGNEDDQLVNQEQTDLHTVSSAIEVLIKGKFRISVGRREWKLTFFLICFDNLIAIQNSILI